MNYHPDDFLRLIEAVEGTGGIHLNGACKPFAYKLKQPTPSGEMRVRKLFTTGCGLETRFSVPYSVPKSKVGDKMRKNGAGDVVVCAVDDNVGAWPRFRHAIQEEGTG